MFKLTVFSLIDLFLFTENILGLCHVSPSAFPVDLVALNFGLNWVSAPDNALFMRLFPTHSTASKMSYKQQLCVLIFVQGRKDIGGSLGSKSLSFSCIFQEKMAKLIAPPKSSGTSGSTIVGTCVELVRI